MDHRKIYSIIYALAALDGREATLFGNCGPYAEEAFSRSLAGEAFPEIWFEIPLAGEPWLDFHSLVSYEDIAGTNAAFSGQGGVYADAIAWFAAQRPRAVRQLALSYDTHTGDIEYPAVQVLVTGRDPSVPLGFLEAVGRQDATESFRTFASTMPNEWFACYVGAFPRRQGAGAPPWVRVECIVGDVLQQAYVDDPATLREHLARVGIETIDEDALSNILMLASSPFPLEFQFNIGPEGKALPVVSASVRFDAKDWADEARCGAIADLMRDVQGTGLVDSRWMSLAGTVFSKSLSRDDESVTFSCFPAFLKLRWREGKPSDAKAYLIAFTQ